MGVPAVVATLALCYPPPARRHPLAHRGGNLLARWQGSQAPLPPLWVGGDTMAVGSKQRPCSAYDPPSAVITVLPPSCPFFHLDEKGRNSPTSLPCFQEN